MESMGLDSDNSYPILLLLPLPSTCFNDNSHCLHRHMKGTITRFSVIRIHACISLY